MIKTIHGHTLTKLRNGESIQLSTDSALIERCCNCGLIHYLTYDLIDNSTIEITYYLSLEEAKEAIKNKRKEGKPRCSKDLLTRLKKLSRRQ